MTNLNARRPVLAIITTVVWGVLLVPGAAGALLSPMMFDAPGSMNDPQVIAAFVSVVSFPILCVVSIAASWIAWRVFRTSSSGASRAVPIALASLPLVPVVYFVGRIVAENFH